MPLSGRETAAEHIRNALTLVAFGGCAEADAITARLRAALREVEAGNLRNPAGDKFLRRAGMPSEAELVQWITRLGIPATARALRVNARTLQKWWAEHQTQANPTKKARAFIARKIRTLAHEGRKAPARVAAAYRMARRAGFRSVPRRARKNPSEGIAWSTVRATAAHITRSFRHPGSVKADAEEIVKIADEMIAQLARGVHENPTLAVLGNPPAKVVGTLSRRLYELRYRHAKDGKDYRHPFGPGASVLCLADGSVLIRAKHRLWEDL